MKKAITTIIISALVCMSAPAVPGEEFSADLVVINANVITVDEGNPRAEELAVKNDKFIAVGATSRIQKLADFVILSQDPTKVPPDTIKDIEVEKTYVGGKLAYEKE